MTTPVLAPPSAVTTKGASKRRSPRDRRSTLLTVLLWILAAYFLVPLVWLLIASTKNNADLFSSATMTRYGGRGDVHQRASRATLVW